MSGVITMPINSCYYSIPVWYQIISSLPVWGVSFHFVKPPFDCFGLDLMDFMIMHLHLMRLSYTVSVTSSCSLLNSQWIHLIHIFFFSHFSSNNSSKPTVSQLFYFKNDLPGDIISGVSPEFPLFQYFFVCMYLFAHSYSKIAKINSGHLREVLCLSVLQLKLLY